jgi:hypothetical protein
MTTGMTYRMRLPMALVSEANLAGHAHWSVRQRRAKSQRSAAQIVAMEAGRALRAAGVVDGKAGRVAPGWRVEATITRHGVRALDSDNLAGAGKHVRDGLADALGIDDRDPGCTWAVEEGARVTKGIHAWCEVHIHARRV